MRANLVEREPQRIARWDAMGLYDRVQRKNTEGPQFILHDGPPFTNGDIHTGHALNKILKDIILRYKSMRGCQTPYIPGWDCHGLPIEHKVTRELRKDKKMLETPQLREACADFSSKYIEKQRAQFQRLGILADWANEYRTMDPAYEAEILRTFAQFIEQGLVYRSKKPVYWSIPCATALAEAEIEYKEHTSPSIWVKFAVCDAPGSIEIDQPLHVVVWTTTPWTLVANKAIALHPNIDYIEVKAHGETYLVAAQLAENFIQNCALENPTLGKKYLGKSLEGIQTRHPFIDRSSPIVLADYITTEAGTGCVHIAPGHGQEDYFLGLKYALEVYSPIDDKGCYTSDGKVPEALVGLSVLETEGGSPANKKVLELLKANKRLLKAKSIQHSYPHCWRSKTPIIFRAMHQWFVSLDKGQLREKVIHALNQVNWIPSWGKNRIEAAVATRPDWCISRQRSWGVPLLIFYDQDGNALLDLNVFRSITNKIAKEGTNFWFNESVATILSGIDLPEDFRGKELIKGTDTLDVWLDSGCSHRAVLQKRETLSWPADLYLEGSDQHRGWFQSSLWTAIIADGSPPYKNVITHGFIVGQDGKKMSKSSGKPITVESLIKKFGVDIIRLWIASEDYRNDITLSEEILKHVSLAYRTIRNTLRFQIGNLYDFDPEKDTIPLAELDSLDQWALHKTAELIAKVTEAYEAYAFHKAYQYLNRFCSTTLSSTYHDILKDRLYTLAPHSTERRSSQSTIQQILERLLCLLAPILCFTIDEAYAYFTEDSDFINDTIALKNWPKAKPEWLNAQVTAEIDTLLKFRQEINEKLEPLRQERAIGQSLDAQVDIIGNTNHPTFNLLTQYQEKLPEIFIVSQVNLIESSSDLLKTTVKRAEGVRCPRCWRWVSQLNHTEEWGAVSSRCKETLQSIKHNQIRNSI